MLVLLAWGCKTAAPGHQATTADDDCQPSLVASVDRRLGVLPVTVTLRADAACVEGTPQWSLPDGGVVEGWELEQTLLASGEHAFHVSLGGLADQVQVEVLPPECPRVEAAHLDGELQSEELDEASGLGVSPSGLLWTHNDSGDGPRLFAMDATGADLGTVELTGAEEGDWEDSSLHVDPLTGEVRLYVGDIGDNGASRDTVVVYVLPEPDPLAGATSDWVRLDLSYPDGPRNADALLVDPVTEDLYIAAADGWLYRKPAPHEGGTTTTLEAVVELGFVATGGDFSPLGDLLVLRDGHSALAWPRDQALAVAENLATEPCPLSIPEDLRGEALAFQPDGAAFTTVSEELHQPIWTVPLVPVEQPCADFEASILRTADGPAPLDARFEVDPHCVPEGIAQVRWEIDGVTAEGPVVERSFLGSGLVDVTVTVVDATGEVRRATDTLEVLPPVCPVVGETLTLGTVETSELREASGLVASIAHPGLLWTHNDSGDVGELFALDEGGALVDTVDLGVSSGDWEDLALGWTDAGWTLFVGDVGDNAEARESITVYLVPEDDPLAFGSMRLVYPDGLSHNCESIAVDPQTDELLVLTKDYDGDTQLFVKPGPHLDGDDATLAWVADLDTGASPFTGSAATTAMDITPRGDLLAVRTYSDVWLFPRDASTTLEQTFAQAPCDGDAPAERQGEAVAITEQGYYLLSEGEQQPLYFVELSRAP